MNSENGFSVLMSLYIKEHPEYVRECFDSLLRQTVKANEWIVVEDGPLTDELYALLREYELKNPGLITRVKLEVNSGLGVALSKGIARCSYELVARMDTDDIAREDRFEKQLVCFKNDPNLDICGSHIREFSNSLNEIIALRKVPITNQEIRQYQKYRDAFNHMTVMYKKSSVLHAGNYQDAPLMEDTLLWVNMIMNGAKCMNIDDYLVSARANGDMFERRGGFSYFKKYLDGRKKVYESGYISRFEYFFSLAIQLIFSILPNRVRKTFYVLFLRKSYN